MDLITVATPRLKEILLPFNPNIEVIPNYLDNSLWKLKNDNLLEAGKQKIVVGYMGGHTHKADLLMVLPALLQLVEKYPERIQFQFWGINPPNELMKISTVNWCPTKSSLYTDFVEYFQEQKMDIAIAPLTDNSFNRCKSPIKFFEYSAIGVPGVYSHITPYENIIENEKDGLLAGSTEEWVNALSKLT